MPLHKAMTPSTVKHCNKQVIDNTNHNLGIGRAEVSAGNPYIFSHSPQGLSI